ncbi:MAG: efflux RND transporter permease subunit [Planctomycetota bacterium]
MNNESQNPNPTPLDSGLDARYPDGRKTFFAKWSTTILCLSLFLVPLILLGSVKSLKVYANDVLQWLPKGFEEARTYREFEEKFGVDEMLVLSWEECTIDNVQVLALQRSLAAAKLDGEIIFERVVSGPDMIAQLGDLGISRSRAKSRLQGLLIGPDEKTTCLLLYPRIELKGERRPILQRVYEVAQAELDLPADELHLGGPTVDGAAIEIESKKSLGTFLWMSVVMVFLLTWYRMRDLPLTLLVIFFSGLCATISLTILYWTGGQMNLTMVMLPTLTFILGVSGSVHMVNYYRKASTAGHGLASADQAVIDGGYPVALSSTTTAVGLISLGTSSVLPIKFFGFYAGAGILASIGVLLLIMPATMYLLRGRISRQYGGDGPMKRRERNTGVSRKTSWLLNWVCRYHYAVAIPAMIAITILAIGIFQLKASVKIQNRFANRTKIISDYRWLETKLGPLVPMEIMLHFSPENELSDWNKMQMVKSIERAVRQTTEINATLSVATFEPVVPKSRRLFDKLERKTKIEKWTREFKDFEDTNLVRVSDNESFWRISLRVAALNDIDYGRFLETVSENVQNQLAHLDQPGVKATLTGGIPLVYKAQHQILRDLMVSFLTAFLIITLIFVVLLRSIQAGLIAMIPNVFPPLVVFGAMGWLGFSIEIGSVMTASVALGIAVDDTLHFITWYRRGTKEGLSRFASIRYAFEHCAKAMIDTSLICGLGVLPFLFGVFMPTVKFASLLTIMLMTALLGDLILLPALLAGPAGLLFRLKSRKKKSLPQKHVPRPHEPVTGNETVEMIRRQSENRGE